MPEISAIADICSVFRNGKTYRHLPNGKPDDGGDRADDDRTRAGQSLPRKVSTNGNSANE